MKKNIYLIETKEPSYLYKMGNEIFLSDLYEKGSSVWKNQFIYITDDSEIEVNNWVFNSFNNSIYQIIGSDSKRDILYKPNSMLMCDVEAFPKQYFKIILTNDPSLDGVQQLTEEQLQEYVANPVHSVEVKSVYIRIEGYITNQFSHFSLVFSPKIEDNSPEILAENFVKNHKDFEIEGFSEYNNGLFNGFIEGYNSPKEELKTKIFIPKHPIEKGRNLDRMSWWKPSTTDLTNLLIENKEPINIVQETKDVNYSRIIYPTDWFERDVSAKN